MTAILCAIFGHKLSSEFTQPDEKFEQRWSDMLGQKLWFEVFFHRCTRCPAEFKVWRWTHDAQVKLLESYL